MKKLFLLSIISLVATMASAQEFTFNGLVYRILSTSERTCALKSGKDKSGAFTIPYSVSYNGTAYTVEEIDDSAFYNNENITSVRINAPAKKIGKRAFYCCYSLASVELNGSHETIDDYAFFHCDLTEITIPREVVSLGCCAFAVNNLSTICINSNAVVSKDYTFESNLTHIFGIEGESVNLVLGQGVATIGKYAFANDYETEPRSGSEWEKYYQTKVQVKFPSTLREICHFAFYYSRIVVLELPEGLLSIDNGAFSNCDILASVTIPSTLSSVSVVAFDNSSGIQTIYANSAKRNAYDGLWVHGNNNKEWTTVYVKDMNVYNKIEDLSKYLGTYVLVNGQTDSTIKEDVNEDGQVNSLDVLKVYKYMQSH